MMLLWVLSAVLCGGLACSHVKNDVEPFIDRKEAGVVWYGGVRVDGAPGDSVATCSRWLQQEWRLDDGVQPTYLVVDRVCPAGECHISEEAVVNSCNGLFAADRGGLWLPAKEKRASYQNWQVKCYAARIISQAKPPEVSFVNEFDMDAVDFRKLPLDIAWPMGWEDKEILSSIKQRGGGLADYLQAAVPDAQIKSVKNGLQMQVIFTYGEGWTQFWELLATGDFNNDKRADLLISGTLSNSAGSVYGHRLLIVTRTREDAPLTVIKEIPLGAAANDT